MFTDKKSRCFGIVALLVLAIIALVTSPAVATVNQVFFFSGPSGASGVYEEYTFDAEGSLSDFSMDLTFGGGPFCGDLLIGIVAPNGAAVEFGGYNVSLDGYDGITFANAGDWPGSWVEDPGDYSHGPVSSRLVRTRGHWSVPPDRH